ncbi:ubiquinol-cytochrome c reductase complex assembly factor 2-like [Calliopsis andreniformis]|uniref:ubiquinol-cytochrome c reductase complex assembly factor 2-like n=1 Tax=Calliopsis andreniformis TaxID=337506 RepID=UPI003FCC4947
MAGTYKNYMKLLESWPLDKAKAGRDLGQHIRDQIKIAFTKGESDNQLNREVCDRYYMSLKRITSNYHGQIYQRIYTSSASGLTAEQCNLALSPELLQYLNEGEKNIFSRTLSRIARYYNASKVNT